jgi:hypothetical protein
MAQHEDLGLVRGFGPGEQSAIRATGRVSIM